MCGGRLYLPDKFDISSMSLITYLPRDIGDETNDKGRMLITTTQQTELAFIISFGLWCSIYFDINPISV